MRVSLDTTGRGLRALVTPTRQDDWFQLTIESLDEPDSAVVISATTEGLGLLVGAVLEQLADEDIATLIANEVGFAQARTLAQALTLEADERERAAQARVGTDR